MYEMREKEKKENTIDIFLSVVRAFSIVHAHVI